MTTRLITDANERSEFTAFRETDSHTALTRGLAEYLKGFAVEGKGGRSLSFEAIFDDYAVAEDKAKYPCAIVTSDESGSYDASQFTPNVAQRYQVAPNTYLVASADKALMLTLEIWASDKNARMAIIAGLEDYLNPVTWMYGCRLELGHYFNARAEYALLRTLYINDEENSTRRYKRAVLTLQGNVSVGRVHQAPGARPRLDLDVSESGAVS